jgi:hypothetical protein
VANRTRRNHIPTTARAKNQRAHTPPKRNRAFGLRTAAAILAVAALASVAIGGVNVRQTALPPQANDAAPELAGLVQQRCDVVYALGPLSTTAAKAAAAATQPTPVTFIAVTDDALSGTHLTVLPATHLTSDQISASLTTALR